jgi:hypothetical protein
MTEHTLGSSMDSGLKRVPRDGPPTCSREHSFAAWCLQGGREYQDHRLGGAAVARRAL